MSGTLNKEDLELKSLVDHALEKQFSLANQLGDLKRYIVALRSKCKHSHRTTDELNGIITCDVCGKIMNGVEEWLR